MPGKPKTRKAEVKVVRMKFRTTLANATLRVYADEAAKLIEKWAKAGATPELSPIVQDAAIERVGKCGVEGVGAR